MTAECIALFAEEVAAAAPSATAAIAMSAIAMVGTIASLVIGWLKDRDRLANDKEMALLKQDQQRCKDDGAKQDAKIVSLEAEIRSLRQRDEEDRRELEAKIETIKGESKSEGNP